MTETQPAPEPKKSDLGTRAASAVVMVAVAGTALWLGGWWWTVFVAAVALGVLWEWWGLIVRFGLTPTGYARWSVFGIAYVGASAFVLAGLWQSDGASLTLKAIIAIVVATDIGAYLAGRTIGGRKIAPKISPSKTWAGLGGGIVGASIVVFIVKVFFGYLYCKVCQNSAVSFETVYTSVIWGAPLAIIAQAGDFFESWMKRRAGAKDSGNLIPGHGGLFDRVDGLLSVCFVIGPVAVAVNGFLIAIGEASYFSL